MPFARSLVIFEGKYRKKRLKNYFSLYFCALNCLESSTLPSNVVELKSRDLTLGKRR